MDAKIAKELKAAGLTLADLTQEELQELKEEIAFKEKGGCILDGVLWHVERRKFRERRRAEMQAILKKKQPNNTTKGSLMRKNRNKNCDF